MVSQFVKKYTITAARFQNRFGFDGCDPSDKEGGQISWGIVSTTQLLVGLRINEVHSSGPSLLVRGEGLYFSSM